MNKQEILLLLDELLELDANTLTGKEVLSILENWDSLAVLGFISLADQKFEIILSPVDIEKANTVDDLIKLLNPNII